MYKFMILEFHFAAQTAHALFVLNPGGRPSCIKYGIVVIESKLPLIDVEVLGLINKIVDLVCT